MRQLGILMIALLLMGLSVSSAQNIGVEPLFPEIFEDMPYVRDLAVSADGKEMFFTVDDYKHTIGFITTIRKKRRNWSDPEVVSFSGSYRDIEPFLSGDGKRLYFASNRPVKPGSTAVKDYDIWYVERSSLDDPWTDPVWLGKPVNSDADEYYPSVADNGDLYFTADRAGSIGTEDIFVARLENGQYKTPVSLEGGVNSASYEFNAFVAPDASYIIFTSYRERNGRRRSDLFISRRAIDGTWGEARLIPEIYSASIDYCPFVDRAGKHLYFTSERNEIRASYADPLDLEQFLDEIKGNPNGSGRIYYVDFSELLESLYPEIK